MKKILQGLVTLCLLMAVLSCGVLSARAASGAGSSFTIAANVSNETQKIVEYKTAVMCKLNDKNVVITALERKEGMIPYVATADENMELLMPYKEWNGLRMYSVTDSNGEEQGFYPCGAVKQNEKVTCVWADEDFKADTAEATAVELKGENLQLTFNPPDNIQYPGMVLNSQGWVCAILTENGCFVVNTTQEEFYGGGQEAPAASATDSLTLAAHFDAETGELVQPVTFAVMLKQNDTNYIFTDLEPNDGMIHGFRALDGKWYPMELQNKWNGLYIYYADPSFGEEQGFYPCGAVKQNEKVTCAFFAYDNEKLVIFSGSETAVDLEGTKLKITFNPPDDLNIQYPGMVLNSQGQVCAILTESGCFAMETTQEGFYGGGQEPQPAEPEPGQDQPPEDQPDEPAPAQTQPPENQQEPQRKVAAELKDLEKIYLQAQTQPKKTNYVGILAVAGVSVLVIALAAAVILKKQKNGKPAAGTEGQLHEAEEGTQLADDALDTGLWVQFRNGVRTPVRQSFSIGRAPDNGVVIPQQSTSVSGHHCEIVVNNGKAYLRDVGSTNGTFVGGRRIPAGQLIPLQPGMQVGLGGPNGPECFVVMSGNR